MRRHHYETLLDNQRSFTTRRFAGRATRVCRVVDQRTVLAHPATIGRHDRIGHMRRRRRRRQRRRMVMQCRMRPTVVHRTIRITTRIIATGSVAGRYIATATAQRRDSHRRGKFIFIVVDVVAVIATSCGHWILWLLLLLLLILGRGCIVGIVRMLHLLLLLLLLGVATFGHLLQQRRRCIVGRCLTRHHAGSRHIFVQATFTARSFTCVLWTHHTHR